MLEVQIAYPRQRDLRDRQVLDRQAGGVEERDLVGVPTPFGFSSENGTEIGDVGAGDNPPATAPANSPPWLACSQVCTNRTLSLL